jgi:hypothetical protein
VIRPCVLAVGPRHTLPNLRRLLSAQHNRCLPATAPTEALARAASLEVLEVTEGTEVKDAR